MVSDPLTTDLSKTLLLLQNIDVTGYVICYRCTPTTREPYTTHTDTLT